MNNPFWKNESFCDRNKSISVRIYNSERSENKVAEYLAYLNSVKIHLDGRIRNIDGPITFHDGEMCCIIYLNDMLNISIK